MPQTEPLRIFFKKMILSNKRVQEEILIAFGLIFLTVLVLVGYLFPGVSSFFQTRHYLPVVLGLVLAIILLGFLIVLQVVEPLIKLSREAKLMAKGDLTREVQMAREDELGELAAALNAMTHRIRHNVAELKQLSQTTGDIKAEINCRIAMLSDMMDVSNRIAQNAPLGEIMKAVVARCLESQQMTFGCVILKDPKTAEFRIQSLGGETASLSSSLQRDFRVELGVGILGLAVLRQEAICIDRTTLSAEDIEDFRASFKIKNAVIAPVSSRGSAYGLLIVGNNTDDYLCTDFDKELLQLLAKHIAIAMLNHLLTKELEKMEVTDALTGLFNNAFARNKLSLQIKEAMGFQRACSFVLLCLDRFKEYYDTFGHIQAEDALIKVAGLLKDCLAGTDVAARFGDHEFALILPGKNKKEAMLLAETIINKIELQFKAGQDLGQTLTCSAAVVENPLDGITADELILKSGVVLADTLEKGGNRVGI